MVEGLFERGNQLEGEADATLDLRKHQKHVEISSHWLWKVRSFSLIVNLTVQLTSVIT